MMERCVICYGRIQMVSPFEVLFRSSNSSRLPFADPQLPPSSVPDIDGWGVSPRGAGFLFGGEFPLVLPRLVLVADSRRPSLPAADIVSAFNRTNSIDLVARAHQLVMEGYKLMFDKKIVTVWSGSSSPFPLFVLPSAFET